MNPLRSPFLILLPASLLMLGADLRAPVARPSSPDRWLVEKTSNLRIEGTTNLTHFCCQVNRYDGPDTLAIGRGETAQPAIALKGQLTINIACFDCSNRPMTKELRKTLKYLEYPQLRIVFVDLEKMPVFGTQSETLKGDVEVSLAGVCKRFGMDYTAIRTGNDAFDLTGERSFLFSDFELIPPSKMGGLIRVNDRLKVIFNLHLKKLE